MLETVPFRIEFVTFRNQLMYRLLGFSKVKFILLLANRMYKNNQDVLFVTSTPIDQNRTHVLISADESFSLTIIQ